MVECGVNLRSMRRSYGLPRWASLVARLKGGDTAIFARTAEEVDRLIEEGIPYEIVPGITAALAVSAYAGIPLTHRDWFIRCSFDHGSFAACRWERGRGGVT